MDGAETSQAGAAAELAEWVEAVVTEHESALLRYAGRMVNDAAAAQDVVQNAFVKLVGCPEARSFDAERLKGWLYRVTHNEAVDYLRREARRQRLHERQSADPALGAEAAPAGDPPDERLQLVLAQMRGLRPGEQQVLLLRLQEGLSYREIGAITGRSEGYVGNLLHQAVRKLARRLTRAMMP